MATQLILQDLEDLCVLLVRVVTESHSPLCAYVCSAVAVGFTSHELMNSPDNVTEHIGKVRYSALGTTQQHAHYQDARDLVICCANVYKREQRRERKQYAGHKEP